MNSEQLMKMIDDYAEARHSGGSYLYNEKTDLYRKNLEKAVDTISDLIEINEEILKLQPIIKAALLESSTDYYQRIGWLLIEQKCVIESLKGENNAN